MDNQTKSFFQGKTDYLNLPSGNGEHIKKLAFEEGPLNRGGPFFKSREDATLVASFSSTEQFRLSKRHSKYFNMQ